MNMSQILVTGQRSNCRRILRVCASIRKAHSGPNAALQQLKDIAISPDQPSYKDAVKIYNPTYSYEDPAFVALPKSVEDIQRCLKVANSTNTPVAIKSGGHCFAGYSTTDSQGFVISLRDHLRDTRLCSESGTIHVQAGASWDNVYKAVDKSGYVAIGGCVPAVGIGGYILGGGYSILSRAYGGLACDNVLEYTMVTADGERIVKANGSENQDLFWALKGGGGGNFGVLVDVTLKLYKSPKEFKWLRLVYDTTESIEKGLTAVGENLTKFPKELNLDMTLDDLTRNKLTLDVVYSDHHEDIVCEALETLPPTSITEARSYTSFLNFTTEYSKLRGFVNYEVEPIYIKGTMIDSLPSSLAKYFASLTIPKRCLIGFVHVGGNIQNVTPTATAFPARSAQYTFYTYGQFLDEQHKDEVYKFATTTYDAVKSSGCAVGSYINHMDRHLDNWPQEYYGLNYDRLCQVKEKWNPLGSGCLHFQQEIGSSWMPKTSTQD